MIHSIDVAADFEDSLSGEGRRTWVAVKIVSHLWLVWTIPFVTKCPWPIANFQTALVPNAQTLINFSNYITQSRNLKPDSVPFPGCPRSTDLDIIFDPGASSLALLSKEDVMDLRELCGELDMVCEHARRRGVKIIIDAESRCVLWLTLLYVDNLPVPSWYQPAIDAVALALMRKFNNLVDLQCTVQPLVYTTYQAYLRR